MKTIPAYHSEVIKGYPVNTWVIPTNNNCNDYDVFANLYEWALVERKIEYHYKGKQLTGSTHYFKHSLV